MKNPKTVVVEDGETAFQCLDRIVAIYERAKTNNRVGEDFTINIHEFSVDDSVDREGSVLNSACLRYGRQDLRRLSESELSEDIDEITPSHKRNSYYYKYAHPLETRLGVPHLVVPRVNKGEIKPRSREDILTRLDKLKNRASQEIKMVREFYSDVIDCQNESLTARIRMLHWASQLFTNAGINNSGMNSILKRLFILSVRRERDRLFYVRRHPDKKDMHKCFNENILSSILEIEWILGCNPLRDAHEELLQITNNAIGGTKRHGSSRF